eukprot:NODE_5313_length_593_cov_300.747212.p1 GENE.NODE_5313_length_593_cov_300.747212~~NODE_5313_length_593_cov_300.747212.p1  ORF type:complete len:161 (+),score=52.68 NODE_5313_length_593_cov_300.747212:65-484(+)
MFATSSFFSGILPIGISFALGQVIMERMLDSFKLYLVCRRERPRPEDPIIFEAWQDVFEALSVISVALNIALIKIAYPSINTMALVLLEHFLLFFKAYLTYSIPARPEWLMREELIRGEKNRLDGVAALRAKFDDDEMQ